MNGFADRPRGNPQSKAPTIHDGNVNEKAIDYDETMKTEPCLQSITFLKWKKSMEGTGGRCTKGHGRR